MVSHRRHSRRAKHSRRHLTKYIISAMRVRPSRLKRWAFNMPGKVRPFKLTRLETCVCEGGGGPQTCGRRSLTWHRSVSAPGTSRQWLMLGRKTPDLAGPAARDGSGAKDPNRKSREFAERNLIEDRASPKERRETASSQKARDPGR